MGMAYVDSHEPRRPKGRYVMRIGHTDMDTRRVRYKIVKNIAANGHKGVIVGVFMVQSVQG